MLMVVFGAGASYGSRREGGSLELPEIRGSERPPSTDELLSEKYGAFAARYPSSRPAIVALRKELREHPYPVPGREAMIHCAGPYDYDRIQVHDILCWRQSGVERSGSLVS